MPNQSFIDEMREKLLVERERLTSELAGLSPHTEMGNNEDDTAMELEVDEVNQDVIARIKADLQKITRALEKIEQGKYGFDDEGKEISEERLRALPWADTAL